MINPYIVIIMHLPLISSLLCYHCTSPLSADITSDGKASLKRLLYAAYNVPPVQEVCGIEDDPEFEGIETIPCYDSCVKIRVLEEDTLLVLRGCNSSLFTHGYTLSSDVDCSSSANPIICMCNDTDLCNHSSDFRFNIILIMLILSLISL